MKTISILIFMFTGLMFGQYAGPYVYKHLDNLSKTGSQEKLHLLLSGSENMTQQLLETGFQVQTSVDKFATVVISRDQFSSLMNIKEIDRITLNPRKKPHNSIAVPYQNVHEAYDKGYTGTDVIVGVIDTGLDFYNPLFLNADGSTRILNIWDQTGTPFSPPGGYTIGIEYTETQINSDLDSGSPNSIVSQVDSDGHGTHVTGSVAGLDQSMSPDTLFGSSKGANIIFVKTTFYSSDIIDGINYIFDQATALGKPCVVNLSLGSQFGPHDGTDDETKAVDALTGPGKIVVRSAGNSGGDFIHYFSDVVQSKDDIILGYCEYMTLWLEAGDSLDNVSLAWDGGAINNVNVGGSKNSIGVSVDVVHSFSANNKKIAVYVIMDNDTLTDKTFTLSLNNLSDLNISGTIERHAWASEDAFLTPYGGFSQGTSYGGLHYPYTLGNEACGNEIITVGAFMSRKNWESTDGNIYHYNSSGEEGGIARFSSIGPTADSRQKPDIIAGGTQVLSGKSKDGTYDDPFIPPAPLNDNFAYMQGTSMSSPVAAGAIALLLEKNSSWSNSDLLSYLSNNAKGTTSESSETVVKTKNDPNTWDRVFGFGAIDLTAAFTETSIDDNGLVVNNFNLLQNYPNPFNPTTTIRYQLAINSRVDLVIYNSIGQRVRTLLSKDIAAGQQSVEWDGKDNLGNLVSSGIYFYRLKAGEFNRSMKMVLIR